MKVVYWAWAISGVSMTVLAIALGLLIRQTWLGILIDNRGRYSLTHFQIVLWSLVVLSLISGVFFGRLIHHVKGPLDFPIPSQVLAVLGISVGSATASVTIKATKDTLEKKSKKVQIARTTKDTAHFQQVFLIEEGELADEAIDVTKFQNFWITVILVVAYVALAVGRIGRVSGHGLSRLGLPGFSQSFVTLLLISHGGYLVGKIPNRPGTPPEDTKAKTPKAPDGPGSASNEAEGA
jgi:hypothetical protein